MRKICVFTGTRAEYGLLNWTMRRIQDDPELQLQVLVSGAHLSERLGETWKQIEADGFAIDEKISIDIDDDSPLGISRAMGQALIGISEALTRCEPDILLILGDRYETFAAATAAMMLRVPIAHIHGGEITEGAIDDSIRHAITKMSHLHFTAAETYRKRVIQLGEQLGQVFNVGAPGLEAIENTDFMTRDELAQDLNFNLNGTVFLVTYHPETLSKRDPAQCIDILLNALINYQDARILFTRANADIHGQIINNRIDKFVSLHSDRSCVNSSLGQRRYISLMAIADVTIGNSSSGIIEAPTLGTPTINIGERQAGRLRASSVIDCELTSSAITNAINLALSDAMQNTALKKKNPYGVQCTSEQILNVLKEYSLIDIHKKSFLDIPLDLKAL